MVHNYEVNLYTDRKQILEFNLVATDVYQSKDRLYIKFINQLVNGSYTVLSILESNKYAINKIVLDSGNKKGEIYQKDTFTGYITDISQQTHDCDPSNKRDNSYLFVFKVDSIDKRIDNNIEQSN